MEYDTLQACRRFKLGLLAIRGCVYGDCMLLEIKAMNCFLDGCPLLVSQRKSIRSMKANKIYGLAGVRYPESNLMECNSDFM